MKTFSRRFGQWFAGGCAAALVGAPLHTFAAEADAANAPVVQVVKTAVGSLPANYKPSASLDEVIKLAQSGVGDQVLLAFIENSKKEFSPSPEDIIFLNDLGVSEAAIAALIRSKPGAAAPALAAPSVPANPAPVVSNGSVPIYTAPPAAPQINGVVAQPAPDAPALFPDARRSEPARLRAGGGVVRRVGERARFAATVAARRQTHRRGA